jgi:fatty acid desaturase
VQEWRNAAAERKGVEMKRHLLTVLMSFVAALVSGTIFVVALLHQYALVEVVASILTGLQVFFMSSAIGDLLEKKKEPNRARNSAVVLVTVFLVAFYSFTRYFH